MKKPIVEIDEEELIYGEDTGVSKEKVKRAFLSGMSKEFKKTHKIKFVEKENSLLRTIKDIEKSISI